MKRLKWLLPIVTSFLLGVFFLNYLTVHPLRMSTYLFLTCLALFALLAILTRGFARRQLVAAISLSIVAFLGGFLLMEQALFAAEDPRPLPDLMRARDDPGRGHTAVIYFTHGEPETYSPIGWINQFKEFDEQNIPFIPYPVRPFFIHQLRNKYLEVGQSGHRQMHTRMLHSLEQAFRAEGDTTTRFYLSFLDDNPRPDAAVIEALNEGASRIVVSEVFVTISNHTAEGKELIRSVQPEAYGATLHFTGPLWDSAALHEMFVRRANDSIGDTDKSKVAVLLVGHGQPDEWDAEWPTETEQEILFRERILKLFEADGYETANLSLAWMAFKEPKPAPKVEEFVANGVEKIVFFAAAISAESIHSQHDIPALVYEADVPAGIPVINLGAWNDDPLVIRAIKERIALQMAGGPD